MKRIIGIGETLFDIVFKNNQPVKSVPGGAIFNCMVSLGRAGLNPVYISEVGRDNLGEMILDFMKDNGISIDNMYSYYDGKSPVSLLFTDDNGKIFSDVYLNYPDERLDIVWPRIDQDDIIVFGSYYSVNPLLRKSLTDLLDYAVDRKSVIYYDLDFHKEHSPEILRVMPFIIENLEYSSIVRASKEDFINIYKEADIDKAYKNHIRFYCNILICTDGEKAIQLRTPAVSKCYELPMINLKNTVGAGDAFNAGVLHAITGSEITLEMLSVTDEAMWDKIINTGIKFASEVCCTEDAFISQEFSKNFKV